MTLKPDNTPKEWWLYHKFTTPRTSRCRHCGYDLSASQIHRQCPECGNIWGAYFCGSNFWEQDAEVTCAQRLVFAIARKAYMLITGFALGVLLNSWIPLVVSLGIALLYSIYLSLPVPRSKNHDKSTIFKLRSLTVGLAATSIILEAAALYAFIPSSFSPLLMSRYYILAVTCIVFVHSAMLHYYMLSIWKRGHRIYEARLVGVAQLLGIISILLWSDTLFSELEDTMTNRLYIYIEILSLNIIGHLMTYRMRKLFTKRM